MCNWALRRCNAIRLTINEANALWDNISMPCRWDSTTITSYKLNQSWPDPWQRLKLIPRSVVINPTPVASKNLNHASRSGSWIFAHVEDLSSLKVKISVLQVGISTYLKSKEGPTESPTVCGSVPQSLAQFGCIDKIEKMYDIYRAPEPKGAGPNRPKWSKIDEAEDWCSSFRMPLRERA